MTRFVCSITAEASDAKKYSTSLSSTGMNSDVLSVRGRIGTSRAAPCGRCSNKRVERQNKEIQLNDQKKR